MGRTDSGSSKQLINLEFKSVFYIYIKALPARTYARGITLKKIDFCFAAEY